MLARIFFIVVFLFCSNAYAQSSFETYMDRCKDLRPTIEQILKEEGLPTYFFYLALAESGCVADNKSSRGARGLYQLMPSTFRSYSIGVCIDKEPCPEHLIDDPVISTRVAAKYLKSLYKRFNKNLNWTIAAYNAGGTNLKRKTKYTNGMDFNVVKSVYPDAYYLAKKVERFSKIKYTSKHK